MTRSALSTAALLGLTLGLSACTGPVFEVRLDGTVVGASGGARAGQPIPNLRFVYELTLEHGAGEAEIHRFAVMTGPDGAYHVDEAVSAERDEPVTGSRARLTLRERFAGEPDYTPAIENSPAALASDGRGVARDDRFVTPLPMISVGAGLIGMKAAADGPANVGEDLARSVAVESSLVLSQCGVAVVPMEYRELLAGSTEGARLVPDHASLDEGIDLLTAARALLDTRGLMPVVFPDRFRDSESAFVTTLATTFSYGEIGFGIVAPATTVDRQDRQGTIAHEVGHYFGLEHVSEKDQPDTEDFVDDTTLETTRAGNLMHWVINHGDRANDLTPGQCARVRAHILVTLGSSQCRPWEGTGCEAGAVITDEPARSTLPGVPRLRPVSSPL